MQYLGNTLAKYFFYDLADAVGNIYGFQTFRNEKKKSFNNQDKISHEQALRRVMQLENTLERTNTMLQELQDEFDGQQNSTSDAFTIFVLFIFIIGSI